MKVQLKSDVDWSALPSGAKPPLTTETAHVLEVFVSKEGEASYRILTQDGSNMLSPAIYFTIVDNYFPEDWVIAATFSGTAFKITYKQFSQPGFWEKYFDDETDAVQTYEQIVSCLN